MHPGSSRDNGPFEGHEAAFVIREMVTGVTLREITKAYRFFHFRRFIPHLCAMVKFPSMLEDVYSGIKRSPLLTLISSANGQQKEVEN